LLLSVRNLPAVKLTPASARNPADSGCPPKK
jgi:hypothetical protein